MKWYEQISFKRYLLIGLFILVTQGLVLYLLGRIPYCSCDYIKIWHGVVNSSENSQHISDWYTFSHIIHGFIFYALIFFIGRRWPIGLRLILAMLIETSWEILENTSLIIDRYREATASLGYVGDSIINSIFDSLAAIFGFILAWRLPVWLIIILALLMEIIVGLIIRDNLTLNIIMLISPIESIKQWQMGM